ncbi:MAG: hypothetical protein GY827_06060 [Cytophagales bacterium]|nr:hypothetical protein [Cytophagales bacterium]
MITTSYNPSPLEVELAKVLQSLQTELSSKLDTNTIEDISIDTEKDNPDVVLKLVDSDGDKHEIVLKVIQRSDSQVNQ